MQLARNKFKIIAHHRRRRTNISLSSLNGNALLFHLHTRMALAEVFQLVAYLLDLAVSDIADERHSRVSAVMARVPNTCYDASNNREHCDITLSATIDRYCLL